MKSCPIPRILKPKMKKMETILFEEPLIDIDMQPTEDVDPLFVDPKDESVTDLPQVDEAQNNVRFDIFTFPPPSELKPSEKPLPPTIIEPEGVKVKQEVDGSGVYIKEEPTESITTEKENATTAYALARALTTVKYLCPRCSFRSTSKEEVNTHTLSHRSITSRPRPCDKCNFIAKTIRELSLHKKTCHPRGVSSNVPTLPTGEFKCPHCEFTSFHKSTIRTHTKIHTTDIIYTCDKCPYSAISKLNMENHAVRHLHTNQKRWKFKCPHCGLLEKTKITLSRHLILHGEGEMLICPMCPYKSPYMHTISQHSRVCHGMVFNKNKLVQEQGWKGRRSRRNKSFQDDEDDSDFKLRPIVRRGRKRKIIEVNKDDNNFNTEISLQTNSVVKRRGRRRKLMTDQDSIEISNKTDDGTIENTNKENGDEEVSEHLSNENREQVKTNIESERNEVNEKESLGQESSCERNEVNDKESLGQESSCERNEVNDKESLGQESSCERNEVNDKESLEQESSCERNEVNDKESLEQESSFERNEVNDNESVEQESSCLRKLLEGRDVSKHSIYENKILPSEKSSKSGKGSSECESDINQSDSESEDRVSSSQSDLTNDRSNEVSCDESCSNLINHDTSTLNEDDSSNNSKSQNVKEGPTFSGSQIFDKDNLEVKELNSVSVNENNSLTDLNSSQVNNTEVEASKSEKNLNENIRTDIPDVLVLKREGNSFACFKKSNKQLTLND